MGSPVLPIIESVHVVIKMADQSSFFAGWQKSHFRCIYLVLKQAEEAIRFLELTEQEGKLRNAGKEDLAETAWLKFRYIVFDLYSVLDYAYYFLCCHFSYNGRPAPLKDVRYLGFPYKPSGVKISDTEQQDQTDKFVKLHLKNLCKSNPQKVKLAEEVLGVICKLQPKCKVDAVGKPVNAKRMVGVDDEVFEGNAEVFDWDAACLAMLHFYRNCVTHRDLIQFQSETSWVQFNRDTGSYEYVSETQKGEGTYCQQLDGQRFWIELPGIIKGEKRHRLLLHVLNDLQKFVRETIKKLFPPDEIQFQLPEGMFCALMLSICI